MKSYSTKLIVSVVAFVVVVGGVFGFVLRKTPADAVTTPVTAPVETPVAIVPSTVPVTAPTTGKYKDGTYSAVGSYNSPGGKDDLNVSLTLKDGIITDTTVTSGAHDPRSSYFQGLFIGGIKAVVVGKSVDTLIVDKVSGSSLTGAGFNDALAKIKVQAKA